MSEAWQIVDLFRCIESPKPEDIIELDTAMMQILAGLDQKNTALIWATRAAFNAFNESMSTCLAKKKLDYWNSTIGPESVNYVH